MDNVISDAIFGECLGVHSRKQDGADSSRQEARATQSSREAVVSFHKKNILKLAHSDGSPGNFFVRKYKTSDRGANQKKKDGADNRVS